MSLCRPASMWVPLSFDDAHFWVERFNLRARPGAKVCGDKIVFTSMYIMSGVEDINPKLVELYQAKQFAPGFFTWIIPIDETTAKVGLGSSFRPAFEYLDDFIKKHPIAKEKLQNAKVYKIKNSILFRSLFQ